MRNSRLKYAGLWAFIIGLLVLLITGWWYIWMTRSFMWFDPDPYVLAAIIGAMLLIPGLLAYVLIEE